MIRSALAAALLLAWYSATAQVVTVDLTASPITGVCPYQTNLSWTASGASTCTKSGAWSGTAPASGSEWQQVNAAAVTFTLTCSASTASRTLTWVNPTQNTDGTAVSLGGNKVYHSNSASTIESQNPPIVLTPARTSYVLSGLPAGPRVVGVKATSSSTGGLDSAMSPLVTATIVLPTGADTVNAGCTTPSEPKPPTGLTISSTVWDLVHGGKGQRVGRDVGTIALGARCVGTEAYLTQGTTETGEAIEYWQVQRTDVSLYRKPRSTLLVGRCALDAA